MNTTMLVKGITCALGSVTLIGTGIWIGHEAKRVVENQDMSKGITIADFGGAVGSGALAGLSFASGLKCATIAVDSFRHLK